MELCSTERVKSVLESNKSMYTGLNLYTKGGRYYDYGDDSTGEQASGVM